METTLIIIIVGLIVVVVFVKVFVSKGNNADHQKNKRQNTLLKPTEKIDNDKVIIIKNVKSRVKKGNSTILQYI